MSSQAIHISVTDAAIERILDIYDYNIKTVRRMAHKGQIAPHEVAEVMQSAKQCAATLRSVQATYKAWEGLDGILDERLNALADKNSHTHQAVKLDTAEGEGRR